jgi:hypothetical protein
MQGMRLLARCALALGALGVTDLAGAVPIEDITQYHVEILRFIYEEDEYISIGDGFFRFDQSAVDRELSEWLEDPDAGSIEIEFPMLAAEF